MMDVVEQRQVLLEVTRHRIANSLQIIANILLLKARAAPSEEASANTIAGRCSWPDHAMRRLATSAGFATCETGPRHVSPSG